MKCMCKHIFDLSYILTVLVKLNVTFLSTALPTPNPAHDARNVSSVTEFEEQLDIYEESGKQPSQ